MPMPPLSLPFSLSFDPFLQPLPLVSPAARLRRFIQLLSDRIVFLGFTVSHRHLPHPSFFPLSVYSSHFRLLVFVSKKRNINSSYFYVFRLFDIYFLFCAHISASSGCNLIKFTLESLLRKGRAERRRKAAHLVCVHCERFYFD